MIFIGWVTAVAAYLPSLNALFFPNKIVSVKPTVEDRERVNVLTSWIQNDTVQLYVYSHMLFCPNQDLCFGDLFRQSHQFILRNRTQCSSCSCTEDCVRKKNCCPWRSYRQDPTNTPQFVTYLDQRAPEPSRFNNVPLDCRKPSYQFTEFVKGYFMITSCSANFTDADVIRRCQEPEHDNDYRRLQPVSSVNTNETYKNLDCALCNDESMLSLTPWAAQVLSDDVDDIFQIDSLQALQQCIFSNSSVCRVQFLPPSQIQNDEKMTCFMHNEMTPRCNVTGQWRRYSSDIERGCLMDYVDPYTICVSETLRHTYKNIFCAMCNVGNWSNDLMIECTEPIYLKNDNLISFSALLDFRETYHEKQSQPKQCPERHVFDPLMQKCHRVFCEFGMKYENSGCVPIHVEVGPYMYEINLIVKSSDIKGLTNIDPFTDILTKMDDEDLQKYMCFIDMMAPDQNSGVGRDVQVFHVAFYARFSIFELHDRKKYIEQFIHIFKLKFSNISNLYDVEISGQSFVHQYYPGLNDHPVYTYRNPMYDEYWYPIIQKENTKLTDKCGQKQMNAYPLSIIAPVTLCPRIIIHKHEARVVVSNFTLCFVEFDFCVKSEYFRESRDQALVEVCVDEYLRGVEASFSPSRASFTEEKILSAVCVSLSSAGSAGAVLTFIVFDEGKHLRGLNIISTTITLFIANVFYFLSGVSSFSPFFCMIVGALTHFFWLAVVTWMSVSCFSIFRTFTSIRFPKEDSRSKMQSFLWNSFYSFLVPFSMVSMNIFVSSFWFYDDNYGYSPRTCYISQPEMVLYTFALPLAVLVVLNIFMVIITAREINAKNSLLESDACRMVFVFCRLSVLTGGAWLFGFFHMIFQIQFFSILQILITGSQGIFIFFAFAVQLIIKRFSTRENEKTIKSSSTFF